jgi:hypothetical protein
MINDYHIYVFLVAAQNAAAVSFLVAEAILYFYKFFELLFLLV